MTDIETEIISRLSSGSQQCTDKLIINAYLKEQNNVITFILKNNMYTRFNKKLIGVLKNEKSTLIVILKTAVEHNPYFTCSPKVLLLVLYYQKELLDTGAFDYREIQEWLPKLLLYNPIYITEWLQKENNLANSLRMAWIKACILK